MTSKEAKANFQAWYRAWVKRQRRHPGWANRPADPWLKVALFEAYAAGACAVYQE